MKHLITPILALALGTLAPHAQAAILAFDGFETQNVAPLNGQSGGTGWTAPTWTAVNNVNVAAASLSYANGAISVNGGAQTAQVINATNSSSIVSRSFEAQTGTVYFSFLFAAPSGLEATDFLSFQLNNDTVELSSAAIGLRNSTSSPFFARISSSSDAQAVTANTSTFASATSTFLLVGKLSKSGASGANYDQIDLFLNPSSLTEPGTADATASADTGIGTVSVFNSRTANLDNGDVYRFDELKIGTTFADVVSEVPEPGSALALLAGAGLLMRGRRR